MTRAISVGTLVLGGAAFGGCGAQDETTIDVSIGEATQGFGFGGLRPKLHCVEDLGEGNYRAHFGYENAGKPRFVAIGWRNRFVPRPFFQGQPVHFESGSHEDVFTADFATGDGWNRLAWWLLGRRALATPESTPCEPDPEPECTTAADCPDDLNECTAEECIAGECVVSNEPVGAECGLGDACDGEGSCSLDACDDVADCPDDLNECTSVACTSGACMVSNEPAGTACGIGDACDGAGGCVDACVDVSDCPDDLNECTSVACESGACIETDEPAGTQCGIGDACDGAGGCVDACMEVADCPDDLNECTSVACTSGACITSNEPPGSACGIGDACDGEGDCVDACMEVADCPDDLNECTFNECNSGACVVSPEPLGTECGIGGSCDGAGACN